MFSHLIKESLVRSQPLNQYEFNFKISLSQLIIGLVITPIVLAISRATDNYDDINNLVDPFSYYKDDSIFVFIGHYFKKGTACIFTT